MHFRCLKGYGKAARKRPLTAGADAQQPLLMRQTKARHPFLQMGLVKIKVMDGAEPWRERREAGLLVQPLVGV